MKAGRRGDTGTCPDGADVLERTLAEYDVPGGISYGLVLRDGRILCALPSDRKIAIRTLSLYQPQRWKAKLLKSGFVVAAVCGVHSFFLRRWSMPGPKGSHADVPGVLIGSTGHLCERAVTVSRRSGDWEVAKLAFGGNGAEILGSEARMLEALAKHDCVPRLLEFEARGDVVTLRMAWQNGRPWNDSSLAPLLDLLDQWISNEADIPLVEYPEWPWIEAVLTQHDVWRAKLPELQEHRVKPSIRHGDLTRPNLRKSPQYSLLVHDWERGNLKGIPGLDLIHFLVQDELFRHRSSPMDAISAVRKRLSQDDVSSWLSKAGWEGRNDELMALNFAMNSGAGYMDQIPLLNALSVTRTG